MTQDNIISNDDSSITVFAQEGYIHAMIHVPQIDDTEQAMERVLEQMETLKKEIE